MKQSLSGVWKAYVMQTMNGQSEICYNEREVDGKQTAMVFVKFTIHPVISSCGRSTLGYHAPCRVIEERGDYGFGDAHFCSGRSSQIKNLKKTNQS